MIEILSDVPIGTTMGWSDAVPTHQVEPVPASDIEVDGEMVPDAPVSDASDDVSNSSSEPTIKAVGFTLPSAASLDAETPSDLFGAW